MKKIVSTALLALVGLVAIGLLSLQTAGTSQANDEVSKRDDDNPDLVLVADDDDDDTNDTTNTKNTRSPARTAGTPGSAATQRHHQRPLAQRHPPLTGVRRGRSGSWARGRGTSVRTGGSRRG